MEKWLIAGNCEGVEKKLLELGAIKEINVVIGMGAQVVSNRIQDQVVAAFPALHKTGKLQFPSNLRVEWHTRPIELEER